VRLTSNLGYKILALVIAILLWVIAQGSSSVERGFDIPVEFSGVPDGLILTEDSADMINVRVLGSRAALRNLQPERMRYSLDVAGAKPGVSEFEVDTSKLDLPRGARLVSRSPSRIEVTFERKASKTVRVRPELDGEVAPGFELKGAEVEPARVRVSGPAPEVLRLSEVPTETIDVAGLTEDTVRDARLLLGGRHLTLDTQTPVKVHLHVAPVPVEPPPAPPRPVRRPAAKRR
jgi:YbbR domain-containing protein